jgi:Raf kinase inhibitor-like YbhB/YbcL family protein
MACTCEGLNKRPELIISGIPDGTKSLAIVIEDPDAPGKIFDHWLVWNIPPTDTIPENTVPGLEGKNSKGKIGYTGPCPLPVRIVTFSKFMLLIR